jgi:GTPase KRas
LENIKQYFIYFQNKKGDSYRKQMMIDEQTCLLDLLDTAGQEEYSAMRDQYIQGGNGFLVVYAINNRNSFEEISTFVDQILRVKDVNKVPMVLCGNKSDLEDEREVTKNEGKQYADKQGISFFETSAKDFLNILESVEQVVRLIRKFQNEKSIQNKKKSKREDKGCMVM